MMRARFSAALSFWLVAAMLATTGHAQRTAAEAPAGVPVLAPGQSLGRALGLSAATNLRDVGGYRAGGGRLVMRGLLYRSDMLSPMSPADLERLASLRLAQVFDLRTKAEVQARPDRLPPGVAYRQLDVLADASTAAPAELAALIHEPETANKVLGGGRVEALFRDGYREFVTLPSARTAYRSLFLALADRSAGPALFHCTTGKDRTGWAAAALLTLLGVPRDAVIADYMRTNENTLPQFGRAIDAFVTGGGDRTIAEAVFGVREEYLAASFAEMERSYGTIERYFADGLGIDDATQQALRERFLAEP